MQLCGPCLTTQRVLKTHILAEVLDEELGQGRAPDHTWVELDIEPDVPHKAAPAAETAIVCESMSASTGACQERADVMLRRSMIS